MKLKRRTFLRAAGVSLALPLLDYFQPRARAGETAAAVPRRMVCICTPLGLHPPFFFPEKTGKEYELTPYLEVLKDFRSDFTVVSGSKIRITSFSPNTVGKVDSRSSTSWPSSVRSGHRGSSRSASRRAASISVSAAHPGRIASPDRKSVV